MLPATRIKKPLPKAVRIVPAKCDYAIVKFRDHDEAYKAEGQRAEFKVVNTGTLPPQVQVHLRLNGKDEKRRRQKECTIDVDFYVGLKEFKPISKLLRKIRIKNDKFRFPRAVCIR